MPYLEFESIWRAMLFREHGLSDVLPHLHNTNDYAYKLFFTSSQNSTFSFMNYKYQCLNTVENAQNIENAFYQIVKCEHFVLYQNIKLCFYILFASMLTKK